MRARHSAGRCCCGGAPKLPCSGAGCNIDIKPLRITIELTGVGGSIDVDDAALDLLVPPAPMGNPPNSIMAYWQSDISGVSRDWQVWFGCFGGGTVKGVIIRTKTKVQTWGIAHPPCFHTVPVITCSPLVLQVDYGANDCQTLGVPMYPSFRVTVHE